MKTVFCIDDDEMLAQIIADRIMSSGYNALAFSTVVSAVEHLTKIKPDVILIDKTIDSPYGEDGIEVCATFKKLLPDFAVKFILFSGLIEDEDIMRGEKIGINEFISKPFDAKKLSLLIDKLLK